MYVEPLSRFPPKPRTAVSASWFAGSSASQAGFRLFCFPYAGGGSTIFHAWARQLEPQIAVASALLPGRESRLREPACTRIAPIIDALASDIFPYLDRPFAFFGHSMGGLVSFELARRLRWQYGLEPCQLFISGRRAPHLLPADPQIHDLPEPEFLAEVERLKGTPKEVLAHPELRSIMIPLLRADFAVCQTYSYLPAPPFRCPITVLGGLQDDEVPSAELEAWRMHTTGRFKLRMLPGDHFFINSQQPAILQLISNSLLTPF
jgi:medium-chain acyl-[acyl-carrier-protein] hydrolase